VTPLYGHALATSPVDASALGWPGREGAIDGRNFFDYFRLTADDRIVFGGGRTSFAPDARTFDVLARALVHVFPHLEGVAIEHRWSGPMGFTLDRLPVIGEVAPGVLHAGAWCGHGIALSVASGALVRDLVMGRTSELPWMRTSTTALPPDPLARLGIAIYTAGLAWSDRRDEQPRAARPARLEVLTS
jgi:glycine/D-amino acid oxidase-like deaminating enzyme